MLIKMETTGYSETSVIICRTVLRHVTDKNNLPFVARSWLKEWVNSKPEIKVFEALRPS